MDSSSSPSRSSRVQRARRARNNSVTAWLKDRFTKSFEGFVEDAIKIGIGAVVAVAVASCGFAPDKDEPPAPQVIVIQAPATAPANPAPDSPAAPACKVQESDASAVKR